MSMKIAQFRRYLTHDIGIDLGTANTLVYVRGKGIVINEPSVVAYHEKTKQVIAIGQKAKDMVGKTPKEIVTARPLVDGVVSDFEITEQMLRYFLAKIHKEHFALLHRPRVVIGLPSGVTEVEMRAVENAARAAGARVIHLVEEPMAAAIGARLPVKNPSGSMIVDIGGGTTEVAVISLGGIVVSRSIRIAGDEMIEAVMQYIRDETNVQIGEFTAEKIVKEIGSVYPGREVKQFRARGRDLITGLPKEITITNDYMRPAMVKVVRPIVEAVRATLEETPPELLADIMDHGIVLAGGGALLRGLDELISQEVQMPVVCADDPLTTVVKGTGLVLEDLESLREVLSTNPEDR